MVRLILILMTLVAISGCSQKAPQCPPQKPCIFPKFTTYKFPKGSKLTKPIILKDGTCIVPYIEWEELYSNKEYLKAQLQRCNKTLIKSNEKYHKKDE